MQEKVEKKVYENRSEILQKAVPVVKKMHDTLIRTIREKMPYIDYYEMPNFEATWIRREVKRLWGFELVREEIIYIWEKAILGF
jgi:Arc/MetJ-type ribon-helix-helix transcriptional regulator